MKTTRFIGSFWLVLAIAGCVSPSQMLVGPQGDVRRCASNGFGLVGAPLAEHSVHNCTADLQQVGYLPIEQAGAIGIHLSGASQMPVTITLIDANSPASRVGLLIGDQIVKVNGQPVLDRAAAMTMVFGKAGESVNLTVKRNDAEMAFQLQRAQRVAVPN